jgi:hypothetical protein
LSIKKSSNSGKGAKKAGKQATIPDEKVNISRHAVGEFQCTDFRFQISVFQYFSNENLKKRVKL